MYLYIENKHFILIEDVYLIIDYVDFFKNKENKAVFEKYKNVCLCRAGRDQRERTDCYYGEEL